MQPRSRRVAPKQPQSSAPAPSAISQRATCSKSKSSGGGGFLIPRAWIGALRDVAAEELAQLAVWPDGSAIELEARDIHISVEGLLVDVLPDLLPESTLATLSARPR